MTSDASHLDRATTAGPDTAGDLYETDFYAWTLRQAALLRAGKFDRVDLANIVEEIESLGRSQRASLKSAYRLIALHLLKLLAQQERASRSWLGTIARERENVADILQENPSLKPQRDALFSTAYRAARKQAQAETGLPLSAFPAEPPFTLAQLEHEDFLPNVADDAGAFGDERQP